jgi:hypothetical protein
LTPREWEGSLSFYAVRDDKAKTIMIRIMSRSMNGEAIDRVAVV